MSTAIATVERANDGAQLMSIIERAATDPAFDVEKMRAVMDMKMAWDAREAEQAYNVAMKACQEEMEPVVRDKMNEHTRKKYASLDKLHKKCKKIWLKHGFSLSSRSDVSPKPDHYRVVTTCRHSLSHKTEHFLDAPPDQCGKDGKTNKTPIQALGSTVSYVRRYLDLMIFDIVLEDEDRDGNRPENANKISDDQSLEVQAFIDQHNLPVPGFLKHMAVECVGDITTGDLPKAWTALRNKKTELENARL